MNEKVCHRCGGVGHLADELECPYLPVGEVTEMHNPVRCMDCGSMQVSGAMYHNPGCPQATPQRGLFGALDVLLNRKATSDGSTASYYELPIGATELQHLISARNMNAQIGEIFRACYRYGRVEHSPEIRDIKKIIFYAQAELERLERLK